MIGTTLNGRFTLEKELGRGGMGAVYRARDSVLERSVAIKVLKDLTGEEVGRKIRLEAQILARLVHENVVRLYDFSADDQTYYFIMEEVDGSSFAKRLKKLTLSDRLRVVAQTADALDYAHRQGVIHRDVKPANVLLTASDTAKLSDFGLSLLSDATQESGIVRGTPHYMSPEQAKGKKLDHRTDLYALGIILYECVAGVPPFAGPVMMVLAQHINAEARSLRDQVPEVSLPLEALITNLMAKNPGDRPGSGREVADRLRALILAGATGGGDSATQPLAEASAPSVGSSGGPPSMAGSGRSGSAAAAPAPSSAMAVGPRSEALAPSAKVGRDLARSLIDAITAEPVALSPDERYLHGHYLAYLLGGSRRRGFLLRRPLDPLNADRARLLLAMTALTLPDAPPEIDVEGVAPLLEARPDVRPLLGPTILAKYLAQRDTPGKRKRFRQLRQQLRLASPYAAESMSDAQGVLNPGLMPQVLEDLRRLAPERTEVDDLLVERWNKVTEVWRGKPEFRLAVLKYATKSAWRDPASVEIWPEVVYPLIERARRQRQLRSGTEAFWDAVCGSILHVGDAGVRLDKAIRVAVPAQVVRELDISLARIVDEAVVEIEPQSVEAEPPPGPADAEAAGLRMGISAASFHDLKVDQPTRNFVRLINPDPLRLNLGELREMWKDAIAGMKAAPGSPRRRPGASRWACIAWWSSPRSARGPPGNWRSRACPTSRLSCWSRPSTARDRPPSSSWPSGCTRTTAWRSRILTT